MASTLIDSHGRRPARVLIAGGGVAALEAVLALADLAPGRVDVQLLAPAREVSYRPLLVAEAFGLAEPSRIDVAAIAQAHGAHFRPGALASVDRRQRVAVTADHVRIPYDRLLLAIGCRTSEALHGAITFDERNGVAAVRELLEEAGRGHVDSIAFALPPDVHWALPLYELALMTGSHLASRGAHPRLHVVTHEERPLQAFGRRVSNHVSELLATAGIELHPQTLPLAVDSAGLLVTTGGSIRADRTLTLPRLRVARIPGVPQGPGGFVSVDPFGLVNGTRDIYAAGDMTSSPVKQGGLATQQADAAAAAIAAAAGAAVVPRAFIPLMRGILLTGKAPEYIRADAGDAAAVSEEALWWPPAKIAGRYLAPVLAGDERGLPLHETHTDHHPALALALDAARAAAGWDDYDDALRWLAVAESLNVVLPREWAEKRSVWRRRALSGRSEPHRPDRPARHPS